MTPPDTVNAPTVAPVEGWYGMTRKGETVGPFGIDRFWPSLPFRVRNDCWDAAGRHELTTELDIIAVAPPAAVFALFGLGGNDAPPPQEPPA